MSPETAIECVRGFIKWRAEKFDALDEAHEPILEAVGWRRGQGDKREFWIRPDVWRDIFDNEPDVAVDAARVLREAGLLRVQDTGNCQAVVEVRHKSTRCYVVKAKILNWQPTSSYGAYGDAKYKPANELNKSNNSNGSGNVPIHNGALPVIPPPPSCPANFSELSAEQKQNFLLSSAMYLQARLLNSGIALDPQDARAIAQLASVAQGIVQTSVKLEQIKAEKKAERETREETIRYLLSQIPGKSE
jgi:hypothetical protein